MAQTRSSPTRASRRTRSPSSWSASPTTETGRRQRADALSQRQLGASGSVSWIFLQSRSGRGDPAPRRSRSRGGCDRVCARRTSKPETTAPTRFFTESGDLDLVSKALADRKWQVTSAQLIWKAKNLVTLGRREAFRSRSLPRGARRRRRRSEPLRRPRVAASHREGTPLLASPAALRRVGPRSRVRESFDRTDSSILEPSKPDTAVRSWALTSGAIAASVMVSSRRCGLPDQELHARWRSPRSRRRGVVVRQARSRRKADGTFARQGASRQGCRAAPKTRLLRLPKTGGRRSAPAKTRRHRLLRRILVVKAFVLQETYATRSRGAPRRTDALREGDLQARLGVSAARTISCRHP